MRRKILPAVVFVPGQLVISTRSAEDIDIAVRPGVDRIGVLSGGRYGALVRVGLDRRRAGDGVGLGKNADRIVGLGGDVAGRVYGDTAEGRVGEDALGVFAGALFGQTYRVGREKIGDEIQDDEVEVDDD